MEIEQLRQMRRNRDRERVFLRYMGKDEELEESGGRLDGRHNEGGGIKRLDHF
jgi:hypothetical protein